METPVTPHEAEADARAYDGIGLAIRSAALPVPTRDARATAGVIVYRNNVRAAFLRALRDTFPVVHRLVGEEFFRYLAHEYFHAHPPSDQLVSRYGDRFPAFLASFEAASGLPYLPDTARLELAWLGAYHAAEAESLEPADFFTQLGSDIEGARIVLHPSVRLVQSRFPIHEIWLHNRNERSEKLNPPASGDHIVVRRPSHKVFTEIVSRPVFNTLAAIDAGCCFAEALTETLERDSAASPAEIIQSIATMNVIIAVVQSARSSKGSGL